VQLDCRDLHEGVHHKHFSFLLVQMNGGGSDDLPRLTSRVEGREEKRRRTWTVLCSQARRLFEQDRGLCVQCCDGNTITSIR
jgi:hypothetical protein